MPRGPSAHGLDPWGTRALPAPCSRQGQVWRGLVPAASHRSRPASPSDRPPGPAIGWPEDRLHAPSIKALGMDPRFDLSKAYWLVAGIAGVNPNEASIGSATWAEWVIDSDLGFEVDAREIPASCTRSAREF